MFYPFFVLAARSTSRQIAFRRLIVAHLLVLGAAAWILFNKSPPAFLGHVALITGIVEGAIMIGWRLAQLPKSQSFEFLLVSPLRPKAVFFGEALVGLARFCFVTLAGLPVFLLIYVSGQIAAIDLWPLMVVPFTWGAITGLALAAWAYEGRLVRKWAERSTVMLVAIYLAIGFIAGEHLKQWVSWLPLRLGSFVLNAFEAFHRYNPFAVMDYWLRESPDVASDRMLGLEIGSLLSIVLIAIRASSRLHAHYRELHYETTREADSSRRACIGDSPLSWWAVKRVTQFSGQINLWLAGGFGLAYAIYTVAEPYWPPWLGQRAFVIFNQMGGIPVVAAALALLAAVPAAFQYGLWDSNPQQRCRRLELLLLTHLNAHDYWEAATAAAWRRGRGYFAIVVLLLLAAAIAGQLSISQSLASMAASTILWGLYFALGFQAFSRGIQANALGLLLTLGLPGLAISLYRAGWPGLMGMTPPGAIYLPTTASSPWTWLFGPFLGGIGAIGLARFALARCDMELRRWYEGHHGRKIMD